jgi:hypothetical protein
MLEKKQRELGDLLKEGAAALIQMRKGIENACTELRTVYSRMASQYLPGPEQGNAVTSHGGVNDMSVGKKQLPVLPIDKPRRLF